MIKVLFGIILLTGMAIPKLGGQNDIKNIEPSASDTSSILTEELAEYPGGTSAINAFIKSNFQYPVLEGKGGIRGNCYTKFVIDTTGYVSEVTIVKGIPGCLECDAEIKRIPSKMPPWKPGTQNGKKIKTYVLFPVRINSQ